MNAEEYKIFKAKYQQCVERYNFYKSYKEHLEKEINLIEQMKDIVKSSESKSYDNFGIDHSFITMRLDSMSSEVNEMNKGIKTVFSFFIVNSSNTSDTFVRISGSNHVYAYKNVETREDVVINEDSFEHLDFERSHNMIYYEKTNNEALS